jgi:hypothetical protein
MLTDSLAACRACEASACGVAGRSGVQAGAPRGVALCVIMPPCSVDRGPVCLVLGTKPFAVVCAGCPAVSAVP